jgi:TonB family protein
MAYRVPRRFIIPAEEPPPYGLFLASLLGHAGFFLMAGLLSAFLNLQADQSKIYIVNLVPAPPPIGSPEPRVVEAPRRVEARTPPKPEPVEAPRPRETPPPKPEKETPPPRPERAETPPPKPDPVRAEVPRPRETAPPPPRPERVPEKAPELPPQLAEIPKPRPAPERPLDLPKRPEREVVARDRTPLPETKPVVTPPPPPAPARAVEPPRPEPPRALPAPAPAPAPPPPLPAVAAKPGPEPVKPGRPDGSASPLSNISVDVSDFPFTYYLRQLQNKITEKWVPPRGASVGGEKAIVLFEIDREGQIKEPSVERSSGNAIYDQSALRAVLEASPFPPLPQGFPGRSLRVHFGFEYKPDQG